MLIQQSFSDGHITEETGSFCKEYISEGKVHVEIRNLIMMVLLPKYLHVDDERQAAFVRAAISRVMWNHKIKLIIFRQIANPTVMEPPGLFFLRPIVTLLTQSYMVGLPFGSIRVHYKMYVNEFKQPPKPGERSICEAVGDRLTPGWFILLQPLSTHYFRPNFIKPELKYTYQKVQDNGCSTTLLLILFKLFLSWRRRL